MNRIAAICLMVSIAIHASLIGVLSGSKWIGRLAPIIPVQQKGEVSLEFVEVPETTSESKVKKEARTISDKTVEAKDTIKDKIKDKMARTKEVYKGKQIAKASPQSIIHSPQSIVHSPQIPQQMPQQAVPMSQPQAEIPKPQIFSPRIPIPSPQPPAEKVPRVEYDVINIPEVSESIFSAPEEGPLAFETQAHKIGPYFKQIKKRIERYWLSYLVFRYQNNAPQESETVVSFKILFSGEITEVNILEYFGDELFKDFCVASIVNTAPYPPLPENIKDEFKKEGGLKIVFTFRYR